MLREDNKGQSKHTMMFSPNTLLASSKSEAWKLSVLEARSLARVALNEIGCALETAALD